MKPLAKMPRMMVLLRDEMLDIVIANYSASTTDAALLLVSDAVLAQIDDGTLAARFEDYKIAPSIVRKLYLGLFRDTANGRVFADHLKYPYGDILPVVNVT